MAIKAYYIRSGGMDVRALDEYNRAFAREISEHLGEELILSDAVAAFSDMGEAYDLHLVLIGSGGSEMHFSKIYETDPELIKKPVLLLTTQANNSLPAAMEILTFLNQRNIQGEILHGSTEYLAAVLGEHIALAATKKRLATFKLANTGLSDWLIASSINKELLRTVSGIEWVDVSMDEVMAEINKKSYPDNPWTRELKELGWPEEQMERALEVYGGVKRIAETYGVQGIGLKCFDLLDPYKISGCLALAILNAEGFYGACEGDERSLVAMTVIGEITGQPVFMANPSRLDFANNTAVIAHCVLPLNMPEEYRLATHFESGLGVAVAGDFAPGPLTMFKMKEDFRTYHVQEGELLRNLYEGCLCRTQLEIHFPDGLDYFVKNPISNHQMLVLGEHKAKVDRFFDLYKSEFDNLL